ncbi:MAG: rod shape-determining protein RodA [Dehalococcoidia bacterium]|jgi:rod shape determining protein RodA|uniref:rod shape-determining protein RodA n=1 Tax=Candidatus Amarobacter glycogenicus TaxID=3140699 RepID=UPI001DFA754E|nr:rod shape-determining protein RodA [Dehalococcoidia bacterium]MBK6560711.1 rod shape-determining protein RodA [Dehalococcoidia bacterium]MBK7124839.1 rod shape-determining protein RodA [Dehalococcoidia bacterium]MBK7726440.1 rod shape-determining protein RodA [Dehalococcoidia bacterium]MBK8559906.1 rod shape-determining protein RodA [Dehalococcoidia bacterium]
MSSVTYGGYGGNTRSTASVWRGWDRFDYVMALAALALVAIGLVLIYSGSLSLYNGPLASFSSPVFKQVVFACAGIAAMLIVSKIDYHYLTHYAWALYGLSIVSLVAILVIGQSAYGSTRWFDLGPVQIQPSEFAKLATILALARYFSEHGGDAKDVRTLLISLVIVAPVSALVFIQPDLGTSIVFFAIWIGIVVVAGANRSHLLVMAAIFLAILPFLWTFAIAEYQVDRVAVLVDSEEDPLGDGYNVNQSKIAVGSGQLFGKGFTNGDQTQLGYLKVATKDFIFSLLSEEFGFVGCMVVMGLFILLLMRGVRAAQIAGDTAGQLVAVGIVMLILMQTFINIAVNVSIFPVTGIPLPFISQGGSSLVSIFISLGILQSIVMRHRAYRQT